MTETNQQEPCPRCNDEGWVKGCDTCGSEMDVRCPECSPQPVEHPQSKPEPIPSDQPSREGEALKARVYECCAAIAKGDASEAIAAILWADFVSTLQAAEAERDALREGIEQFIEGCDRYCNKCGYIGPDEDHSEAREPSCRYSAVESAGVTAFRSLLSTQEPTR